MEEWRDFFHRLHRETEVGAILANLKIAVEDDQRRAALVPRVTEAALKLEEAAREAAIRKIEEESPETAGPCVTVTSLPAEWESTPTD
jgi:hypothetical protein